jgi:hypothetical protein
MSRWSGICSRARRSSNSRFGALIGGIVRGVAKPLVGNGKKGEFTGWMFRHMESTEKISYFLFSSRNTLPVLAAGVNVTDR